MRGLPGGTRLIGWSSGKRAIVALAVVFGSQLAYGWLQLFTDHRRLDDNRQYLALVNATGWQIEGDVFRLPATPPSTEVPAEIEADPRFVLWRSWSPEQGSTRGSVASPLFPTPDFIAIPYQGSPGESATNRLFVQCDATGREAVVATGRTPDFSTVHMRLGASFCAGESRVIAVSDGAGYIAVGTPFETTARQFHLQNDLAPRVTLALAAIALLSCLCFVAHFAALRWLRYDEPLIPGLALIGCLGMIGIALFVATPFAPTVTSVALVGSLIAGIVIAVHNPLEARRWRAAAGRPIVLWSVVSIAYITLLCAADSGGGSWSANSFFRPLRWSTDNQLPMILAEAFYHRVPADRIMTSPWHGFDRTPLLGGMLLPFRVVLAPLVPAGQSMFVPIGYAVVSIVLLSTWVIALYEGCRLIGRRRAATFVVALAALCPFFLFNTVYAWPKLLGGAFAVLAFCLLQRLAAQRRSSPIELTLVGIFASCSYLSHASNAFVLLPIALYFLPTIVRQGLRPILLGTLACGLLVLSWTVFVAVTQPHSNGLLRFALANDFGLADRTKPLWDSMATAYGNLGWSGWLRLKAGEFRRLFVFSSNITEMAAFFPGSPWAGASRIGDFATLASSLGLASYAALIALVLPKHWSVGGPADASRPLAIVGAGAVVLAVLVQLPEAITHQLPYGAAMLIFTSGALLIHALGPWHRILALAMTIGYGLFVWVYDPVVSGIHHNAAAIAVLVELGFLLLGSTAWWAAKRRMGDGSSTWWAQDRSASPGSDDHGDRGGERERA